VKEEIEELDGKLLQVTHVFNLHWNSLEVQDDSGSMHDMINQSAISGRWGPRMRPLSE
jgi:hypothetical protein